jgi:hypothetical protein
MKALEVVAAVAAAVAASTALVALVFAWKSVREGRAATRELRRILQASMLYEHRSRIAREIDAIHDSLDCFLELRGADESARAGQMDGSAPAHLKYMKQRFIRSLRRWMVGTAADDALSPILDIVRGGLRSRGRWDVAERQLDTEIVKRQAQVRQLSSQIDRL